MTFLGGRFGVARTDRLTPPTRVLAIGGAASFGEQFGDAMKLVADDMQSVVIPGTGHFVAEEAPDEMLAALTAFLAPHREKLEHLAARIGGAQPSPAIASLSDLRVSPTSGTAPQRAVQRRLRPDEVAQLVEQYKAGATERALSARFGIHRSTVAAHLERAEGRPASRPNAHLHPRGPGRSRGE